MRRTFLGVCFVSLFTCASVSAQVIAQIHGTVQDAQGASVPGAEVKATQTGTGASRTVSSSADGSYVITNLPIGPYRLEVSKAGFTKYVQEGIVLQVNSDPQIDAPLKVGAVSEQVVVEANATQVETRASGVGTVVENQRILELPLNGRNVTDLITLAGAAVETQVTNERFFGGVPFIGIGGGVPFGTQYTLDGANHMNFLTGVSMPIPFPDAAQEFKVETSGLTAQHAASASVSVVTKSGTNDFHGDLFYFIRNGAVNGRPYLSTNADNLKRNQYGGTFGGPIIKNKLFFFGAYQGTKTRQLIFNNPVVVPTPAVLQGDWTTFASAACNNGTAVNLAPSQGFTNNTINPALYSPPAVFVAQRVLASLEGTPDQCGRFSYGTPNARDDEQYIGKVDYQINDKHTIFGRIITSPQFQPNSLSLTKNLLTSGAVGSDSLAHSYSFGDTYVLSSTMVNAFRMSFNRISTHRIGNDFFSWCTAGVRNFYCSDSPNFFGTLAVVGGFNMGATFASTSLWAPTNYSINDDVNYVKGAHQMTFGFGAWQGRVYTRADFANPSQTNFNGQITGSGTADFMLGRMNTLFQGLPNVHQVRQNSFNLYFTDTWKVNQRLSINIGLRYEPFLPQTVINGAAYNFDINRFNAGTKSSIFVNAPAGFYYPGDPGFPGQSGNYRRYNQFSPRIGLAWDPTGSGKTSIRASWSLGYVFNAGIWREDASGSNPWGGRSTYTRLAGGLTDPWAGYPGGNPYPYVVNKNVTFPQRGLFLSAPYDFKTPNVYSWNFSIQRQIQDWLLSATYMGNRTLHVWGYNPINPALIVGPITTAANGTCPAGATIATCSGTNNTDARRRLSLLRPADGDLISHLSEFDDGAYQFYHGLLVSLQRRFKGGVSANANYTWSHCFGILADINSNGPPADETYTRPNLRTFDAGNCITDRRHIFNLTAVYETPRFANDTWRAIGTGWRLSGIYRVSAGTPVTVFQAADRQLTGILRQRPNQVLGNPYLDTSGDGRSLYLNPAAFSPQPFGTFGNLGYNNLVAPGWWNVDVALSRSFTLKERTHLEVRGEAFNISNSYRPGEPGTNFGNLGNTAQFGRMLTARDPRVMQFALKLVF